MAIRLEAAGVDLIELSGGTYESGAFHHKKDSTKKREAFFIECVSARHVHIAHHVHVRILGSLSASGLTLRRQCFVLLVVSAQPRGALSPLALCITFADVLSFNLLAWRARSPSAQPIWSVSAVH